VASNLKTALITGITGQDGSHLADLLIDKVTRFTAPSGGRRRSTPGASITSAEIP